MNRKETIKLNRKETIEHFLEWYCYTTSASKGYYEKLPNLIDCLENYIDSKHYNFSPFKEIKDNNE